ncbi:isochorismatase family protein [Vibrio fluvialis]|uniref:isochorismatase family protein n=1 Tax=Vibrio fluvialis TaxID=676 RepID=UPI0015584A06|nr:isochorismatase family protein [Vibrio fluvialis]EKO3385791.1 isochorismatase family protein [Vibrio fluvialis]EKO3393014.1 isochorismatase family protein [Vibrio fluvialis]EKO3467580.1 isochorismatase family protein [Vibrio fluvialis]EKO3908494.1 isochorismatase family protein [Vibrio fluvialis]EKO4004068.1 isochorismatase family protein [Vibrio fluvialis]
MLGKHNTGLIVVDIQGRLAQIVQHSDALIHNVKALIQGAQILELPIIWLEQTPHKLGETHPELCELLSRSSQPIEKFHFGAGKETAFVDAINRTGATNWLVCGIEAHICVYQTVCGLLADGLHVEVVQDCVSSRAEANLALGLHKMAQLGAHLTSVEMCLYELVEDCRAAEFKPILQLIK